MLVPILRISGVIAAGLANPFCSLFIARGCSMLLLGLLVLVLGLLLLINSRTSTSTRSSKSTRRSSGSSSVMLLLKPLAAVAAVAVAAASTSAAAAAALEKSLTLHLNRGVAKLAELSCPFSGYGGKSPDRMFACICRPR